MTFLCGMCEETAIVLKRRGKTSASRLRCFDSYFIDSRSSSLLRCRSWPSTSSKQFEKERTKKAFTLPHGPRGLASLLFGSEYSGETTHVFFWSKWKWCATLSQVCL